LLRRARAQQSVADSLQKIRAYRFAGFELNVRLRRLTGPASKHIPLTNSEFNLLAAFLAAPQHVLSRDQLLGLSRLHNDEVYDRSVDVQVGRLRKKIQPGNDAAELIRTERGWATSSPRRSKSFVSLRAQYDLDVAFARGVAVERSRRARFHNALPVR
jgi:DNA-binding response OmpR family regulator